MKVRDYRPEDEYFLRKAYLARGFEGGWRPIAGAMCGVVVEDDAGKPVVFMGAHVAAEFRAVVDQDFATPKMRWLAAEIAHDEVCRRLKNSGVTRFTALLEGESRGFGRRMQKLRGWVKSRGLALEREI